MAARELVINVADLLRRPGARRHERLSGPVGPLVVVDTTVAGGTPAELDVTLEWVSEGVLASGSAATRWTSACRRCLAPVDGPAEAEFRELFEPHAREGESYPLEGDRIDLEPLAREALLLSLPLAPLCRPDCAGLCPTCGADLNLGPCPCPPEPADHRWAALDQLAQFDQLGDGPVP